MHARPIHSILYLCCAGWLVAACATGSEPAPDTDDDESTSTSTNTGGAGPATVVGPGAGGSATGGSATGGSATGGAATGGAATGGSATGGSATGGSASGGSATGGAGGFGGAPIGGAGGLGGQGGQGGAPVLGCALTEDFTTFPPAGWAIEDGGNSADTWFHCDPAINVDCDEGEFGLANGAFAVANSDFVNTVLWNENLVTPALDCTGATTVTLGYDHNFQAFVDATDVGEVAVSTDGGTVWTPVVAYTADTNTAGETVSHDISTLAAGQASVLIRFHYEGDNDWWWMVDTVAVTSL